jgi:hypothetical protein
MEKREREVEVEGMRDERADGRRNNVISIQ